MFFTLRQFFFYKNKKKEYKYKKIYLEKMYIPGISLSSEIKRKTSLTVC